MCRHLSKSFSDHGTIFIGAPCLLSLHPAINFVLNAFEISSFPTLSSVTDQVGLGRTRFIHLFREAVGLTPKQFCRIRGYGLPTAEKSARAILPPQSLSQAGASGASAARTTEASPGTVLSPEDRLTLRNAIAKAVALRL
ncbi:helix-turn-helix transcriptional regulator [Reticulibacter mediterranei]|uniref:helix-turn-helix transcriptional regulator n=1 Tax=Reticulibacter mediterranei TaxID=2778369 RepID=UPI001C68B829|nr:helix-turn-helix transcriptional regulator [Reticulibacter mediterranei]